MDRLREFLDLVKKNGQARNNFLGLLHVLIGRRIATSKGEVISRGMTWRELAALLRRLRWDVDSVRQLEIDIDQLPQRDRLRFWYLAIARAGVDSEQARQAGDRLAKALARSPFHIGPAPGA